MFISLTYFFRTFLIVDDIVGLQLDSRYSKRELLREPSLRVRIMFER